MPRLNNQTRAIAQETGLRVNGRQKSIFDDRPKSTATKKAWTQPVWIAEYIINRNVILRELFPEDKSLI